MDIKLKEAKFYVFIHDALCQNKCAKASLNLHLTLDPNIKYLFFISSFSIRSEASRRFCVWFPMSVSVLLCLLIPCLCRSDTHLYSPVSSLGKKRKKKAWLVIEGIFWREWDASVFHFPARMGFTRGLPRQPNTPPYHQQQQQQQVFSVSDARSRAAQVMNPASCHGNALWNHTFGTRSERCWIAG